MIAKLTLLAKAYMLAVRWPAQSGRGVAQLVSLLPDLVMPSNRAACEKTAVSCDLRSSRLGLARPDRRSYSLAIQWIAALLLALAMPLPTQATPPQNEFCVSGWWEWCYPTREAAEAAIRTGQFASHPADVRLEHKYTTYREDGTIVFQYVPPPQPPQLLGPLEYSGGSWLPGEGCAGVGPYFPHGCSSEEEVVQLSIASLTRDNGTAECFAENFTVTGSYVSPLYQSTAWGSLWEIGFVNYTTTGTRQLEYDYRCPNIQERREISLTKYQDFLCPDGYDPAREPPGYRSVDRWQSQLLCLPDQGEGVDGATIETRAQQVDSCRAGPNPCYPATGDKERIEPDFEFAGRPFERNYHSLRQFPAPNSGEGWRHTFNQNVERFTASIDSYHFVGEHGHAETFKFGPTSATAYSSANSGRKMVRTPGDGSVGVKVIEPNGDVKVFDRWGVLQSITNASSPKKDVFLFYDAFGRLSSVADLSGRSITFVYANDRVAKIILPDATQVEYRYDAQRNLTEVEHAGLVRQYHYGEPGLGKPNSHELTGITSETGERYATFSYDALGRVTSSRLQSGTGEVAVTVLNYVSDTRVDVTTPTGLVKTYTIANGDYRRILAISDAGGTSSFNYDGVEVINQRTARDGSVTAFGYQSGYLASVRDAVGTPDERKTTYVRNAANQVTRHKTEAKQGASWVAANDRSFAYDGEGRQMAACEHDVRVSGASTYVCGSSVNAPTGVRQTRTSYCDAGDVTGGTCPIMGLVKSMDGPRTDVNDLTTFTYRQADDLAGCDNGGACHFKGDLWKVTDALGRVSETVRYDRMGRVARSKDINGVATDYVYHPRGWLTARKVRGSNDATESDDAITRYEYNNVGQVKKVIQPDGAFVAFVYDDAMRLKQLSDNFGNTITYQLDGAGNRIQEDTRDPGTVLRRTLSRVYDQLGQLEVLADASANATDYTYDAVGNVDTITDALGRVTDNDHDALGRLRRSIANVAGTGALRSETQFAYDASDNLRSVIDPKGLATSYDYNGLNELVQLTSPDTGSTTYGYDSAGNRTAQQDARGVQTLYQYDALNRPLAVDVPSAGQDLAFGYDSAPTDCPAGERFPVGRLAQMTDASGSTRYCYDRRGNVVRKVQSIASGPTRTVRYAYGLADRLETLTYPSGAVVTYTRDAGGRVSGVAAKPTSTAAQVSLVSAVAYQPFGPLSKITFGNGRQLSKDYDLNYGIDSVTDSGPAGLALDFSLDDVGNVTGLAERLNGGATAARTIEYDPLERLTALKNGATLVQRFEYDATGNRTKKVTTGTSSYTYALDSHRLTKVGTVSRSYDAVGNTTATTATKAFTYDDRGRMAQYLASGVVSRTYQYNGRGERVAKRIVATPTSNVFFVYDEAGRLLGEYNASGARIKEYVWLDDTLVAVLASHASSLYQYVLTDHLGTPRAVVHPVSNVIVWRWDLTGSAFGEHTAQNNPDGANGNYVFNLRYPGQYFDSESGLHYNYYRDYEPQTGRYIQSDPMGLSDGTSTYSYVGSSPVAFSDEHGLARSDAECCRDTPRPPAVGGSRYGGFVSCCEGRKVACVDLNPQDGATANRIFLKCNRRHENSHMNDEIVACPTCTDPPQAAGVPAMPRTPPGTMNPLRLATECPAWRESLGCLQDSARECGSDQMCRRAVKMRVSEHIDFLNSNGCY